MNLKDYDLFLQTFKKLESVVKENNYNSVKDYEDSLPEEEGNKLRMCRNFRNYIAHESDYSKMLTITPFMQDFLEKELYKLDKAETIVKKKMTPIIKGIFDNEFLESALLTLQKKKVSKLPIFDKNNNLAGIITLQKAVKMFSEGVKINAKICSVSKNYLNYTSSDYIKCNENTPYKEVMDENLVLVCKGDEVIGYIAT